MKCTLRFTRHTAVLDQPVGGDRRSWRERSGLLIEWEDDQGNVGRGEASPLPGYSPDDLTEAEHDLRPLANLEWALPESLDDALAWIDQRWRHLRGAARFALDMALLDLLGQREHRPAWSLLTSNKDPVALPLAHLVSARDEAGIAAEIDRASSLGYHAFKLKIGADAQADQLRCSTLRRLRPAAEIRLDANRAWSEAELLERIRPFRDLGCAYIEEPLLTLDLQALAASAPGTAATRAMLERLPVPLALDESLQSPGAAAALDQIAPGLPIAAIVVKPMVLGGIGPSVTLAQAARRHGLGAVFSHLFDGPLALDATAALALCWGSPDMAQGLAPHRALGVWPHRSPCSIEGSRITPWHGAGFQRLSARME